jgi:hypothetical protein
MKYFPLQIDKLMPKDNGFLNWEWRCFSGESWPRIHELGPLNPPRGTLIMFCWIVTNCFTAEKLSVLRFRRDLIKMTMHVHGANLNFLIPYFYFLIIYFFFATNTQTHIVTRRLFLYPK